MSRKEPEFPVGPVGKRNLRKVLTQSTDPAKAISEYQKENSLHTMMAKAFGTRPSHDDNDGAEGTAESLDSDSVMEFLSHLGVRKYEVHKRVSDMLLKQLDDCIKHANVQQNLELLRNAWPYATTIAELRPVLWAVFKHLGEKTPKNALLSLAEEDDSGSLKHAEIFQLLPPQTKRLVFEADWEHRISYRESEKPKEFLSKARATLLLKSVEPLFQEYFNDTSLRAAADKPFVPSRFERKIATSQRRALKFNTEGSSSGRVISQIRDILCDISSAGSSVYRPKLLNAVLSALMSSHGLQKTEFLGGSEHLHCTLAADLLLSTSGPLPKAYTYVLTLARNIDDTVREGLLSDIVLSRIQGSLKQIFDTSEDDVREKDEEVAKQTNNSMTRQLNRIIAAGIVAMKESDPQGLFLNPVTDAIAPGYSKVISRPMSISTMEEKVQNSQYKDLNSWESDVKLMFKNCIEYNRGVAGQWFRGEAQRQGKVFREEIISQARRLYQTEIAKRSITKDASDGKRKNESGPTVEPLPAASKKRKKDAKDDGIPSMPALASLLLSDPFFVRIVIARVLQELRRSVASCQALPLSHKIIPSLLQLLHLVRWSSQICAIRGRKYFVPDSGLSNDFLADDPASAVPHATLRRYIPLLVRQMIDADLDRRLIFGGDLHEVAHVSTDLHIVASDDSWAAGEKGMVEVVSSLVQGSLVHLCVPGNTDENSLGVTFRKFSIIASKLGGGSDFGEGFLNCLVNSILRHKTKLRKSARDSIVQSWLKWIANLSVAAVCSNVHEYLVHLLNEWSALGNQVLPRDDLVSIVSKVVAEVEAHSTTSGPQKLSHLWESDDFRKIRQKYDRMLRSLPGNTRENWLRSVGLSPDKVMQNVVTEGAVTANDGSPT